MSQIHKDSHHSRLKKFFTGNGFYLSLAACVVAVGGVAIATFADDLGSQLSKPQTPSTTQNQAVDKNVTGVSDTRTTTSSTTVSTTTTSTTLQPQKALYVLPLSNVVAKEYSNGKPVYNATLKDFRLHNGIDFAGENGDPVMALSDGTVTSVKTDSLWGGCVTIDHGFGVVSLCCGVTAEVKKGDTVKAGDVIGKLSSIPCEEADGAHLHLELSVSGEGMDPQNVISQELTKQADATKNTTTTTQSSH